MDGGGMYSGRVGRVGSLLLRAPKMRNWNFPFPDVLGKAEIVKNKHVETVLVEIRTFHS